MTGKAAGCKHFVPGRLIRAIPEMANLSKFKACPHRFVAIAAVHPNLSGAMKAQGVMTPIMFPIEKSWRLRICATCLSPRRLSSGEIHRCPLKTYP
ncbi:MULTISPECIES: hypothetical protein [Rhizobium]|uniref:Uncharacterized protein n=1 Tax=Rhizobium phaseoli TaxID=396 RepID=A0A7X6J2T0_9HYPH|nr:MULTISPECIES: hypothetical protein [Rhizobium]MDE8761864.1 hypothetical protein [Rhizobium sp. CBK13]NKF13463.1 hypothetical protein [Rhizobium phaseoli]QPK07740.1 hypothetical protein HER27_014865 [Rhizobium phaseoli]